MLYNYDQVNLLDNVVEPARTADEPAAARTTHFAYNSHNARYETRFPNGVTQLVDYEESKPAREANPPREANDTDKIEGIRAVKGSETLIDQDWSYVDEDNENKMSDKRQEMDDHRRGEHTTYDYDHLDRLTVADTNSCPTSSCSEDRERFTYNFDPNSNRLMPSDTAGAPEVNYAYNETNALCWKHTGPVADRNCTPQPSGSDTVGYDYDLNGNLTSSGDGRDLDYNVKDQTTFAKAPRGAERAFDELLRR